MAVTASLPDKAADTTPESPWPVRTLSMKVGDYIDRMSPLWVEGQIVQLNRRPGAPTCYLTLRDTEVDMSFSVTVHVNTLNAMGPAVREGARVVVQAKPTFWTKRGSLHLQARQMKAVGVGDLLARLEHLKTVLRSEGLFDQSRKRRLPFLPGTIGLIVGRASAAEKDVVENARRRWPAATFAIRQVAVQGPGAVAEVTRALQELDADRTVDVIVISRGGGSLEDLLPFSNEALVRAVAQALTPVVSAIGHDVDTPLLDFVADLRASTPTDAAKAIVPSLAEETSQLRAMRGGGARALQHRVTVERRHLEALRTRPVLIRPEVMVDARRADVTRLRERATYRMTDRLGRARDQVGHLRGQVRSLSPLQTLERGYAVVRDIDGAIITDPAQVAVDELLHVTVASGDFGVRPVSEPPH
ncbi:exodeoxyribonuclease VII large subunit [Leekyejoonella antrihumi]|uniref:Exodeoxyribonuclease 7 large subunit n=1 Tax=Leekyejoonella antrihumi TaxID=1660198 RepID=A0A563E4J7_9MICO|nr:exodeoxyribonuclease VII large subunit [Leekyejoonella antrihumi]TWP37426.1 exodeoxyribonuclease VII large subunit [Leekyejoonella antrihumi]